MLSSKEKKRHYEKNLYFECGLPRHIASSHYKGGYKGKTKEAKATGRGGYNALKKTKEVYIASKDVQRSKSQRDKKDISKE